MIFHVIDLMYVAYVFIYQSLIVVYILAYKFDILQIFKSTVYRTRIVVYHANKYTKSAPIFGFGHFLVALTFSANSWIPSCDIQ